VVLPASHRITRAPWYSGTCPRSLPLFAYGTLTHSGRPFQGRSAKVSVCHSPSHPYVRPACPTTSCVQRARAITRAGFRLFPVRSPLLRESRLMSFPPGTEMFHFPGFAFRPYGFRSECPAMKRDGLPHSGILGSLPASGFPRLIAAGHALHRLLMPRHPPYALCSLTTVLLLVIHASLGLLLLALLHLFNCQRTQHPRQCVLPNRDSPTDMTVELTRIERATSCLQSRRSPN
jgi:hypothetical protein